MEFMCQCICYLEENHVFIALQTLRKVSPHEMA